VKGFPSLPSSLGPGSTQPNSPRATITTLLPLGHLPLPSHRFLFQRWGHWMDWSPAFLLVISLLVTYASLLLVGAGTTGLILALPSSQLYAVARILATEGRVEGGVSLGNSLSDPSWHIMTPTTSAPSSWPCSCGSMASLCVCTPCTR